MAWSGNKKQVRPTKENQGQTYEEFLGGLRPLGTWRLALQYSNLMRQENFEHLESQDCCKQLKLPTKGIWSQC
jgi:hypothetical protein